MNSNALGQKKKMKWNPCTDSSIALALRVWDIGGGWGSMSVMEAGLSGLVLSGTSRGKEWALLLRCFGLTQSRAEHP